MIDFTKYEGESFATLAQMYSIERNDAIKQYARFKARGSVR